MTDVTVITTQEVTNLVATQPVSTSTITSGSVGPQGLSAYLVAVTRGFVGTEEDWLNSLMGNPRDLVVTKGIGELATLTIDFSNRLSEGQTITSVTSVIPEPSLTITNITNTNNAVSFDVAGGSLYSGHRLTIVVQTTAPIAYLSASFYLLNI